MFDKEKIKAYSTIFGGFCFMNLPGSLFITGVISPYIKSYYALPKSGTMSQNILPMGQIAGMCAMPFGSYLIEKNYNPKLMLICVEVLAISCFLASAFMENFYAFTFFYVIGFGSFNFIYMIPIHHGWLWFPNSAGLVSGIIISGYGFGSFIFDTVSTHVINPDNLKIDETTGYYPEAVDDRFRHMMIVLTCSWACIALIVVITVFPGPVKVHSAEL